MIFILNCLDWEVRKGNVGHDSDCKGVPPRHGG